VSDPLTLYLPFHLATHGFNLSRLLASDPRRSWSEGYRLLEQFDLSGPERQFTLVLLRDKTNLWLFRCNQRAWCGDFIVVDMLTQPAADLQLANQRKALAEIAGREAVIATDCAADLLRGDPAELLRLLLHR